MARRLMLGGLIALTISSVSACTIPTKWDCHYDSYHGTSVTCSYQGLEKFSTEVLPPAVEIPPEEKPLN